MTTYKVNRSVADIADAYKRITLQQAQKEGYITKRQIFKKWGLYIAVRAICFFLCVVAILLSAVVLIDCALKSNIVLGVCTFIEEQLMLFGMTTIAAFVASAYIATIETLKHTHLRIKQNTQARNSIQLIERKG